MWVWKGCWQGPVSNHIPESMGTYAAAGSDGSCVPCPQVDLAVVEVGIGGTYDCTNIIR